MRFTYEDQVEYTKIALALLDHERANPENLETVLAFGELIKKHSEDNNWVIYDTTEYIYEQLRLLRNEDGAYDDIKLRERLDNVIKS